MLCETLPAELGSSCPRSGQGLPIKQRWRCKTSWFSSSSRNPFCLSRNRFRGLPASSMPLAAHMLWVSSGLLQEACVRQLSSTRIRRAERSESSCARRQTTGPGSVTVRCISTDSSESDGGAHGTTVAHHGSERTTDEVTDKERAQRKLERCSDPSSHNPRRAPDCGDCCGISICREAIAVAPYRRARLSRGPSNRDVDGGGTRPREQSDHCGARRSGRQQANTIAQQACAEYCPKSGDPASLRLGGTGITERSQCGRRFYRRRESGRGAEPIRAGRDQLVGRCTGPISRFSAADSNCHATHLAPSGAAPCSVNCESGSCRAGGQAKDCHQRSRRRCDAAPNCHGRGGAAFDRRRKSISGENAVPAGYDDDAQLCKHPGGLHRPQRLNQRTHAVGGFPRR